jgi:hypothetical protein
MRLIGKNSASPTGQGQTGNLELSGGERDEADDLLLLDRHVRRADGVTKLVLPGEALKEAIEVDVARREVRPIVLRLLNAPRAPSLAFQAARAARGSARRSLSSPRFESE